MPEIIDLASVRISSVVTAHLKGTCANRPTDLEPQERHDRVRAHPHSHSHSSRHDRGRRAGHGRGGAGPCRLQAIHPYYSELKRLPAAALIYPGSRVAGEVGSDSDNQMGGNPATYGHWAMTNFSADEVAGYYDKQLSLLGWTSNNAAGAGDSSWSAAYAWTKDGRTFELGIYDRDRVRRVVEYFPDYAGYSTIYETCLQ